jgi:hypothetical protein
MRGDRLCAQAGLFAEQQKSAATRRAYRSDWRIFAVGAAVGDRYRTHRPNNLARVPSVSSLRTLGEIAACTSMLIVACSRCDRRGRCRLDALIDRHGADAPVRVIVPELIAGCPQRDSPALMERCDIRFPELRELFPAR